jgi:hypothetical protein
MARTIFWSWQSDASKRETRDLIQVALYAAASDLAAELEPALRLEVDQDVKGVMGMAPIAETILEKIGEALAFVSDVTPIAVVDAAETKKHIPNPNVMLELGYARSTLGMGRLIPVFNKSIAGTRFEDLPFDLRHLTGAISYELPKGASKSQLRIVREQLRRRLVDKLRPMLWDKDEGNQDVGNWHARLLSDPSIWAEGFNPLPVNIAHRGRVDVIVAPAPRIFARLLPAKQKEAPTAFSGIFPGMEHHLKPIGDRQFDGLTGGKCAGGHIASQSIADDRTTRSIVRWYKDNGEIWAISTWGFYQREGHPQLAFDEILRDLARWLEKAVQTSRAAGGSGPFRLILGAAGLNQVHWWRGLYSPGSNLFFGLNPFVHVETILANDERQTILTALAVFMNELTDNFGVEPMSQEAVATLAYEP